MCGIVGYVGKRNCTDVLINGLSKLEYRGYDSAGIAVFQDGKIAVAKSKGRLKDLEDKMEREGRPEGNVGIGHTRWATHGEPSDVNSHPHSGGRVTITRSETSALTASFKTPDTAFTSRAPAFNPA